MLALIPNINRVMPRRERVRCYARTLVQAETCISKIAGTNVETLPVICASSRAARTLPRSHFQESIALINLRRIFPRAILRHRRRIVFRHHAAYFTLLGNLYCYSNTFFYLCLAL